MLIICSHCQTGYELDTDVGDTVFVCHRCGHEFSTNTYVSSNIALEPPTRQNTHLLAWFIVLFTFIAAPIFWFQYDTWVENRSLRSAVINVGFTLPLRDKDWFIVPESIRSTWVTRSDDSKALVINGRVSNLLSTAMLPPDIEITFFSSSNPDQRVGSQLLHFTFPPSRQTILQAPYHTPATDHQRIAALGKREFVFLFESLPENTGDFMLTAKAR